MIWLCFRPVALGDLTLAGKAVLIAPVSRQIPCYQGILQRS
jgi:hypothetical protein